MNPAWDEDTSDGKDNDCDGRTDERWSGLTVLLADSNGGGSVQHVDTIGEVDWEVKLDSSCQLVGIDAASSGWVGNNTNASLATVDESGACSDLADFSDSDFGLQAVAAHPDGFFLASTGDGLYVVDESGTVTELATWSADPSDPDTFERFVWSMAVDIRDSTVALFDAYGGLATWSFSDGLVSVLQADPAAPEVYIYQGVVRDGGGFAALGQDVASGSLGVYDFDPDAGAWTLTAPWEAEDFTPSGLAVDGDSQDAYLTARGGWYNQIWRVRHETGEQGVLYQTPEAEIDPDLSFASMYATYE